MDSEPFAIGGRPLSGRLPGASGDVRTVSGFAGLELIRFRGRVASHAEGDDVSTFGDDLIQSLNEALAHARGDGPAIVHAPVIPREVRRKVNLTQAQMAPLMGMSLSGYRKWEQGTRRVSGPAATLLRVIEREPEAVKRAIGL